MTPEDKAEQFIQAAIDSAPEPLRRLGEWLTNVLDDDQWKTADRMLLGAAVACQKNNDPEGTNAQLLANALSRAEKAERDLWEEILHSSRMRERAESSESLVAELREKVTEAEKYNGFHQQACLRIERLEKALLRLQNGVAVALDALPEDQQDGTVGNFLAAIHRECCTGLSAGKGADECEGSTP